MTWLVLAHFALASGFAWALGKSRRERPLEIAVAFFVPGVGPLLCIAQMVLERLFRRRASRLWSDPFGYDEPRGLPSADVRGELSVVPFWDVLSSRDPIRIDRAMGRMVQGGDPAALRRLRESLGHPEEEVRLCARSHLVRVEDRLLRSLRSPGTAEERGRTYWRLAALSPDVATSRQRLLHSSAGFQEAGEELALEHGRVLLELEDWNAALQAFRVHLERHPGDGAAAAGMREAEFRLGRMVRT